MKTVDIKTTCWPTRTIGVGMFEDFHFTTLELPRRDNEPFKSCIPGGYYTAKKIANHPKFKKCFLLMGVPGREGVFAHSGNFTHQIEGCILIGTGLKDIDNDNLLDVTSSVAAIQKLWAMLPDMFRFYIRRLD